MRCMVQMLKGGKSPTHLGRATKALRRGRDLRSVLTQVLVGSAEVSEQSCDSQAYAVSCPGVSLNLKINVWGFILSLSLQTKIYLQ